MNPARVVEIVIPGVVHGHTLCRQPVPAVQVEWKERRHSREYRAEVARLWIGYRIGAFFVLPHATNAARPPSTMLIGVA